MLFGRVLDLFRRKKGEQEKTSDAERVFALRHHAFKMFLTSWNTFQETMTQVEYTLCCDHPFGLYRIQELCSSVAIQVYQCIQQLSRLDEKPCATLTERFTELQEIVAEKVYPTASCPLGPMTIPLGHGEIAEELRPLIDPATSRLEKLRVPFPGYVPQGFCVTRVGCHHFFGQGDLEKELARRTQAAGGYAPLHLAKLSKELGELCEAMPLPDEVAEAILDEVRALRGRLPEGSWQLLLRGRIWPLSDEAHTLHDPTRDPGLLLWGPPVSLNAGDEEILQAFVATLARRERAQALIYRRARGLTDDDAGFCVTCLAVEQGSFGGLAHTGSPLNPKSGTITVYACQSLPQDMEESIRDVDVFRYTRSGDGLQREVASDPSHSLDVPEEIPAKIAELALQLEADRTWPVSLTWVWGGGPRILLVRPLMTSEKGVGTCSIDAPVVLEGGLCASRGCVSGTVFLARRWEDVRRFPKDAILVIPNDQYRWVAVLDRCAGIIAETGVLGSRLGSLAREFGKPAVFGMKDALTQLPHGTRITLWADHRRVYLGECPEVLETAPRPHDFMVGSPVWHLLQHAAEYILPFTMDVESVDFRAANCATYHDIARFCHERAVSAMFSLGAARKYAASRVKQLKDDVPKQFWVVNLSDGFRVVPDGPVIDIGDIASVPMQALWTGMNAQVWEGPPPVDGKGFLSVLFEATANPDLEPSAQTTYFSEKNYFLISRDYASLHSRFGFHFVSVEARLGERLRENYIVFQLRGGAANIERRILRVRFVADLLWEFGFEPQIKRDALQARVEGIPLEDGKQLLAVAGYLTIHTRQLDMIMEDRAQVKRRFGEMLAQCRLLFSREDL